MNTLLLYLDLQYVSGQSSLGGSLELPTSASALNRSKYKSLPPGRSSNVQKSIGYSIMPLTAPRTSFIKNILEQADFDGYGKPLYHLISWALLKRRYTHQHEIRRSKGKRKEEITSTLSPPSHRHHHRGLRSRLSIFFHLCM